MNWAQTLQDVLDKAPLIGIGVGLFLVALFFRAKKDWWVGFRALIMLAAGICMMPLLWAILAGIIANPKHTAFLQWLFQMAADATSGWTNPFGVFTHMLCALLASDGLPYIFVLFFGIWLIHDLIPRVTAFRGNSGGPGNGPAGTRGFGDRLAALHEAEPHTAWVALFMPAMIALIPPITLALHMPVGG